MLRQNIAKGFIRNPSKFTNDFDDLKGTTLLDPLESLKKHDIREVVSDDDDEQEEKSKQSVSMLRRSKMVDIEEEDFPKATALRLSTMHMVQIVEEEEENGLVKSYIFEKPEPNSINTSIMTEILEESEIIEEVKIPTKRTRNSKYPTIQSMLHSLGLGRYALNFETRGVSTGSFIDMTEDQLKEIGIPKRAREKILDSKVTGDWEPILTNSIIMPDSEENKVIQKKSLNKDIKIDPNFIIEQGTGKPKDKIEVLLAHTWDESVDPNN